VDSDEKFLVAERLDEKSHRTGLHCGSPDRLIVASGDDNHARLRRKYAESRQHFQTGHAFHLDIEHHQRHSVHLDVGEESLCVVKKNASRFRSTPANVEVNQVSMDRRQPDRRRGCRRILRISYYELFVQLALTSITVTVRSGLCGFTYR